MIDEGYFPDLVILNSQEVVQKKPSLVKKLISYPWQDVLFRLYNRFVFRPDAKKLVDLSELLKGSDVIQSTPIEKGISNYLNEDTLNKIRDLKPHFILRFGFGILKGEVLDIPKHGVWSFHHGDEQYYRGAPPGFWEIYNQDVITGAILQRLTSKLDAGYIIRKAYYKTVDHSWNFHLNRLLYESSRWPLQAVIDIKNSCFSAYESKSEATIYKSPRNLQFIRFGLRILSNKIRFHYYNFLKAEDWNVGIINQGIEDFVKNPDTDSHEITWLKKKTKNTFLADPFLMTKDTTTKIIAESYSLKDEYASVVAIDPKSLEQKTVIDSGKHLSYPGTYEFNGDHYCIPESFSVAKIALHKWNPEKEIFEEDAILIDKVNGVDPTLLFHENKYWLFFTKQDLPSVNLYIYYADSLKGPYQPHANNPVKSDIRSSRPAGHFIKSEGKLLRPVQDCAKHYGAALRLMEVTKLSTTSFEERLKIIIEPKKRSKFNQGIHTLNGNDSLTIIDGKRFTFIPQNLRNQIKTKLNK
jgi:hypothetical protein